jgi:OOP family OmpA-OmpF porin
MYDSDAWSKSNYSATPAVTEARREDMNRPEKILLPALLLLAAGSICAAPEVKQVEPLRTSPAPHYRQLSLTASLHFAAGSRRLDAAARAEVASLLGQLKGKTIQHIRVEGHSDDRGAAAFNQRLSEHRASTVRQELIANGIAAGVIATMGYGETRPLADNSSAAGRGKNRRVDIVVEAQQRGF